TTDGVREARVIIAADGINSRLRRDAGLQRASRSDRYGISAHLRLSGEVPPRIEVIAEDVFELYFTPVGEGLVNIAMLFRSGLARRFKGSPAPEFAALLRQTGIEGELVDEPLMAGPFPAEATALFNENLVLCGDAAGFFDPITGEGMSHALRSAHLCADAVSSYLKDGNREAFAGYARRQRAMERNPTLLARLMLFLAAHQTLGHRVLFNLRDEPDTLTKLIAINNGSAGFADLRPRDFAAMLLGR
ncbi:MAG: NAD(P)/FAD-dependent oxidoreductase, partial [Dehalococcoidia bacterium]